MYRTFFALLFATCLTGCASLQPREAFPDVAREVEQRTGGRAIWNQGTADDVAADAAVGGVLARDLTADSAVQIALLNNRNVQSTYEELGIAQAELVQAGLLTNPIFSALVRFPDGGNGGANVELAVSQNFIELFSLALRKKVAAASYQTAKARVVSDIVGLAADVKSVFFKLQAAEQMLDLRRSVVDAAAASADVARRMREAGNITELALATEQAMHGQAKLELTKAEAEAVDDREQLLALLGLWGPQANVRLARRLPEMPEPDHEVATDGIETLAVHRRLDLAAAVGELNAAYASLGVTRQFSLFGDAELGVDAEHEVDGSWVTGPSVAVPIPIFDTGVARVSVASARARQAANHVYVMTVQVRSDARRWRSQLLAARERAGYYRDVVVPLRQKITQQTQLQYNAMNVGAFQLLEAKRNEIDAGSEYVQSLRDYWLARCELERAVGGRLPEQQTPSEVIGQDTIQNDKKPPHHP